MRVVVMAALMSEGETMTVSCVRVSSYDGPLITIYVHRKQY